MREIKFRAWEKQLQKIIPVKNIDLEAKIINRKEAWKFFHEIEIMPSTGLRDKNDVEIYEGDICYINNNLMIVKNGYHVSNSVLELNGSELDEIHGFYAESPCGSWCLNLGLSIKKYNVSVIGNVYENKELLEEK